VLDIALFKSLDILSCCLGGVLGNRFDHGVVKAIEGILPILRPDIPKNHHVLHAMRDSFVGSLDIALKSCRTASQNPADYAHCLSFAARLKDGSFAFTADASNLPLDLLVERVAAIYGHDGEPASGAASRRALAIVEHLSGSEFSAHLRKAFIEGDRERPGWAVSFELLFADRVKESTPLFRILQFDRSNALYARAEELLEFAERQEALIGSLHQVVTEIRDELSAVRAGVDAANEGIADLKDQIAALTALVSQRDPQQAQNFATAAAQLVDSPDAADQAIAREIFEQSPELAADSLIAQALAVKRATAERYRQAARLYAPFAPAKAREAYEEAVALDPEDVWSWIELGRLRAQYATLADARRCFDAALQQVRDERDRMVLHVEYGDVLRDEGVLPLARVEHDAALVIAQRLADSDPADTDYQRDLSVSHNNLGDIACDGGDLAEARRQYEAALAIRQRLADADPGNAGWQRDLSVSHERLGDIARDGGDLAGARRQYEAALAIRQRLADADPGNAGWQHDLSVSHNNLGDIARDGGDLAEARRQFEADLAIAQRLADADPGNAGWQRDLSVSHERLGDIARDGGDLAEARRQFEADLSIAQRLAATDPGNAGWQRDLFVSLVKVAQLVEDQGDTVAALVGLREAERLIAPLAALSPDHAGWERDLAWVRRQIARLEGK